MTPKFSIGQRVRIYWHPKEPNDWHNAIGRVVDVYTSLRRNMYLVEVPDFATGGFSEENLEDFFTSLCREALDSGDEK